MAGSRSALTPRPVAPPSQMAKQVHEALEQFGFMFLENSGQLEAIQELRAASLSFFRLPEDEKQSAGGQPGELRGYYRERSFNTHTALGQEGTPDCCSQFFMVRGGLCERIRLCGVKTGWPSRGVQRSTAWVVCPVELLTLKHSPVLRLPLGLAGRPRYRQPLSVG